MRDAPCARTRVRATCSPFTRRDVASTAFARNIWLTCSLDDRATTSSSTDRTSQPRAARLPSLQQLDEAVRAFIARVQRPTTVTVVVDATSRTASTKSSATRSKRRVAAGELISPPAGVIGRGDAFLLQIADRADAVVLSNDSFQEFHGQYAWLFDEGRLVGRQAGAARRLGVHEPLAGARPARAAAR